MFRSSTLERLLLVISDAVAFVICFVAAFWVQFRSGWIPNLVNYEKNLSDYIQVGILLYVGFFLLFSFAGLYRSWLLLSRTHQALRVARAILVGGVFAIVALFGSEFVAKLVAEDSVSMGYVYGSRFLWILVFLFSGIFLVVLFRMLIYLGLRGLLKKGFGAHRLLILGATATGKRVAEELRKSPERGQLAVGFVDERYQVIEHEFAGLPVLGKYADLAKLVRDLKVSGVVIAHDSSSVQEITRVLVWLSEVQIHIYLVPDLYSVVDGHFKANLVHGFELRELFPFTMPPWQVRVKRFMDIVIASTLLLCSLPISLLAAILIKLDSKGPVFYSQERVGLYGQRFMVHKFRTMRTDAEKNGAQWATKNDPRITRVGHFLRKTRIDELPQLLCVLKGDMSMVGPRPERAVFIEQLREEIPFYMSRLKMKPGLTGWAQVRHHYDTSTEDVKIKLQYDLYYYENMSLLLDIQILFRTIYVVLTGKGAQ
ncbi:MAG: sugar transferase [Fibrobacteraceae bacterium]|jgi:exopolysaccharide biosynthesis polyprenyl glycosylphosphotransferase|nr:sugar transferase [Fibrobacteraceae bacterium]